MAEQVTSIPYVRRKRILDLLVDDEIVTIEALQAQLAPASISTIRRDLMHLQAENLVEILRGGAVKQAAANQVELPVMEKLNIHADVKACIAQCAANLVQDGDTIYIDSGTTTSLMIHYLRDKRLTIVTSSIQVIADAHSVQATIVLLGGELNRAIGSISGPTTDAQLQDIFFDKAFIGASGFSLLSGINTFDTREASKKRIVQKNSKVTYVLADASKAGKNAMCRAFTLADCVLITDQENEITGQVNALIAEP